MTYSERKEHNKRIAETFRSSIAENDRATLIKMFRDSLKKYYRATEKASRLHEVYVNNKNTQGTWTNFCKANNSAEEIYVQLWELALAITHGTIERGCFNFYIQTNIEKLFTIYFYEDYNENS